MQSNSRLCQSTLCISFIKMEEPLLAVCLSLGRILCREIIKIRSLKTLNVWAHSSKKYIYIYIYKKQGMGRRWNEKKKKEKKDNVGGYTKEQSSTDKPE